MTPPTRAQAQIDLDNSKKDKERLILIVENLRAFIIDSGGEDRAFLKSKLMFFESILSDCHRVIDKINLYIDTIPL